MNIIRIEPGPAWAVEFVVLGPAEFLMGAAADDRFASSSERPVRKIALRHRFALGVFPVTTEQWGFQNAPSPPKTGVSWRNIQSWLVEAAGRSELPLRLPSEAEWEYAARAGADSGFPGGDTIGPEDANFLHDDGKVRVGPGHPTPRGTYPPNAFGLEDMLGNVAEWTADAWWPDLTQVPEDGRLRAGDPFSLRTARSAGWDALPRLLRLSARHPLPPDRAQDNLGFRLAFDLP